MSAALAGHFVVVGLRDGSGGGRGGGGRGVLRWDRHARPLRGVARPWGGVAGLGGGLGGGLERGVRAPAALGFVLGDLVSARVVLPGERGRGGEREGERERDDSHDAAWSKPGASGSAIGSVKTIRDSRA